MKITRTIGTFCAAAALLTLGGASYGQSASPSPSASASPSAAESAPAEKGKGGAKRQQRMEEMLDQLQLTDAQKEQIKPLMQDQFQQMKAVRDDATLTQEQKKAKVQEIHKGFREKLKAILTPEQLTKWEELMKQHRRGPGGGADAGAGAGGANNNN